MKWFLWPLGWLRDLFRTPAAQRVTRDMLRQLSITSGVIAVYFFFYPGVCLDAGGLFRASVLAMASLVSLACSIDLQEGKE